MKPLRYVILHHMDVAEPHFDLMFETLPGSDLATWRSPIWPIEQTITLTRLRDHRRFFLQYEGALTNERGMVQRVADGECEVEIGEADVLRIQIINGTSPTALLLRKVSDNQWEVGPK
jgi:hypothetical protein